MDFHALFEKTFHEALKLLQGPFWVATDFCHYTNLQGLIGIVENNEIWLSDQERKNPMPDTASRPSGESLVDAVPRSELGGKITPRATRPGDPQHGLNKLPIIGCRASRIAGLAWQKSGDPLELIIAQTQTDHPDLTQMSECEHKSPSVNSPCITR